jgi:hypothetical protein
VIDVKQRCLCAFHENRLSFGSRDIQIVRCITHKRAKPFSKLRHLLKYFIGIQWLAAVRFNDSVSVFKIAFYARAQNIRDESVCRAYAAPAGLVFIGRTNTSQRGANLFVAKPLFAGVIERAMIGKYQVCAGTNLHAVWRDLDALRHQAIGLFEESLGIDHHAVPEDAYFAAMNDAGRQQMQNKRLVSDLYGVARVMSALVAGNDVEMLGKEIDDLAFAFVAPLGPDDYDDFGHGVSSQLSVVSCQ